MRVYHRARFVRIALVAVGVSLIGLAVGAIVIERTGGGTSLTVLLAAALSSIIPLLGRWWRRTLPSDVNPQDVLPAAADSLAEQVLKQWQLAERQRGLFLKPVPAHWKYVSDRTDRLSTVTDYTQATVPFTQPSATGDDAVNGDVRGLHNLLAADAPRARLVIMGEAGTGKTAAAIRMVLNMLKDRESNRRRPNQDGSWAPIPVPVMVTPHGWNPNDRSLESWLADRLATDFSFLETGRFPPGTASKLIEAGYVTLFFDGFDEVMAPGNMETPQMRRRVIDRLNQFASSLILMTRREEFREVERDSEGLVAKFVEIRSVPVEDAVTYLASVAPNKPAVGALIERIIADPAGAVAVALRSPLNLSLIKEYLIRREEDEFLSQLNRLMSADEVEAYLFVQLLPLVYSRTPEEGKKRYGLEDAQRWLGFLARRMRDEGTSELAWWQVHRWAPRSARLLMAGLLCAAAGAIVGTIVSIVGRLLNHHFPFNTVGSAGLGLAVGLAGGFSSERRYGRGGKGKRALFPVEFNAGIGLWSGAGVGSLLGAAITPRYGLVTSLTITPLAALVTFIVAGITSGTEAGLGAPQSKGIWSRIGSRFNPAVALAVGLPLGLGLGYTLGEGFGSLAGAVIGITAGLLDRFSQLSISAAVPSSPRASWESSRKHARKVAIAFGLAFGLANGIVYGIFDGIKEGLLSGVVIGLTVAFTVGAVAGIAVWIGASETWRTSLAFLQLSLGGRAPREGIDFLNDAYETRNILRTAGPIYQFRHARLQELLADQYEAAAPRLYGRMVPSIPSATG